MSDPMPAKQSADQGAVRLDKTGFVSVLHLDRPAKMNALTPLMLNQLTDHARTLARDDETRVVLVTSEGDRAFCTGADINAFAECAPLEVWRHWIGAGHEAFAALAGIRQPSIAVLQGAAFGGGLELALACDLRVAAMGARLGLPEAGIGTVPGWGGTARLTAVVGRSRANRLILTGESIDSTTAEHWGLVDFVVPPDQLMRTAHQLASQIAARAPVAVQLAKQLLTHATADNVAVLEAIAGALSATTLDSAEGIAAFRDHRSPEFLGR
jgi:enoyl-CoA hydratase